LLVLYTYKVLVQWRANPPSSIRASPRYDPFISKVRASLREDFHKGDDSYSCTLCGTPIYHAA